MNIIRQNVLQGAIGILGGLYVYVGISEASAARVFGILGGLLVVTALFARYRSRLLAAGLLVIGTAPLAISTWWSIVTPLIAVLVLLLGGIVLSREPRVAAIALT